MYAKVIECYKMKSTGFLVRLKLDQPGLKSGVLLGAANGSMRWKVKSRILYSPFRELHKRFKFEKIDVIHVQLEAENKEKLKLELLKNENENIFQYRIEGVGHKQMPKAGDMLICTDY